MHWARWKRLDVDGWMEILAHQDLVDLRISGLAFLFPVSLLCFLLLLSVWSQTLPASCKIVTACYICNNMRNDNTYLSNQVVSAKSVIILWGDLPVFQSVTVVRGLQGSNRPSQTPLSSEKGQNQVHGAAWPEIEGQDSQMTIPHLQVKCQWMQSAVFYFFPVITNFYVWNCLLKD